MRDPSRFPGSFAIDIFPSKKAIGTEETAKTKKSLSQTNLLDHLGEIPLTNFDRFTLQLHVDKLAKTCARDTVLQMRAYLRDIFSNNFRKHVLGQLQEKLNLPKLTFQVIRRTMATLSQTKGTVKDTQGMMRHARLATTTDVYMQVVPDG